MRNPSAQSQSAGPVTPKPGRKAVTNVAEKIASSFHRRRNRAFKEKTKMASRPTRAVSVSQSDKSRQGYCRKIPPYRLAKVTTIKPHCKAVLDGFPRGADDGVPPVPGSITADDASESGVILSALWPLFPTGSRRLFPFRVGFFMHPPIILQQLFQHNLCRSRRPARVTRSRTASSARRSAPAPSVRPAPVCRW
jgi:hypothetical protein